MDRGWIEKEIGDKANIAKYQLQSPGGEYMGVHCTGL